MSGLQVRYAELIVRLSNNTQMVPPENRAKPMPMPYRCLKELEYVDEAIPPQR